MSAYQSLAASYDRLTNDVKYDAILSFALELLRAEGKHPHTVLDLACGTGSMSYRLAERGYRVIGVDMSEDMLTQAYDKTVELKNRPLFIHQKMQRLRLPRQVDWVISCLDSIDYILDPEDCRETFRRVYAALRPGGVFLFDVNTPEKLMAMDGQVFLDEDDDVYCIWRGEFDRKANICRYGMDLFQRRGRLWQRSFEEHREYAYSQSQLTDYLTEAGFRRIRVFGDCRMEPPGAEEQRMFFLACKEEDK